MTETNYAVPPGEYLAEWLEENGMRVAEAAERLQWTPAHTYRVIAGKVNVGATTARRLERLTGITVGAWIAYEGQYRMDLERLRIDRVRNAMLLREARASTRLDRDGTFSLGPQDIVTFSKEALYQALRSTLADLDYDLLKALENPEDEDGQTLGDVTEGFLKKLKEG